MDFKRALVLAVLMMTLSAPATAGLSTKSTLAPGAKAPDFAFVDFVTKKKATYYEIHKGIPTLVAFVQTACRSCKREVSFLNTMLNEAEGFKVLLIFIDHKNNSISKYVEGNNITSKFTVIWDDYDVISKKYGVNFSPASFLVDENNKIVAVYKGFHKGISTALRKDLGELLNN